MERDQILDIRPPKKSNIRYQTPQKKNQISDITPIEKIKYQISDNKKNQISSTPPPPLPYM